MTCQQKALNLHSLKIHDSGRNSRGEYIAQQDFSVASGQTRVYFKNLEDRLIDHISDAQIVMGCVAWLTSEPILRALAQRSTVIVVQKEDFLRPDLGARDGWSTHLRRLYDRLKCDLVRMQLPGGISDLSIGDGYAHAPAPPVRCVGNYNKDRIAAFPRAHHKFVIFGKIAEEDRDSQSYSAEVVKPYAVWTGSYNFTKNAGASFENAIYTTDPVIVAAYVEEFGQVFSLSEPLDWTSEWAAPEYRIGT